MEIISVVSVKKTRIYSLDAQANDSSIVPVDISIQ
ncbi:unnamed protein product [Musa acuminata subsp. burmannicoides]